VVPEPSSLSLVAVAFLALAGVNRRRRRRGDSRRQQA